MNGRWREELRRVFLDPSSTQKQKPENQRDHCQDADSLATAGAILTTLLPSPLLSSPCGQKWQATAARGISRVLNSAR